MRDTLSSKASPRSGGDTTSAWWPQQRPRRPDGRVGPPGGTTTTTQPIPAAARPLPDARSSARTARPWRPRTARNIRRRLRRERDSTPSLCLGRVAQELHRTGYDCSGAVSTSCTPRDPGEPDAVRPMASSWGVPEGSLDHGLRNASHAYMIVAGLRFARPLAATGGTRRGPRWRKKNQAGLATRQYAPGY